MKKVIIIIAILLVAVAVFFVITKKNSADMAMQEQKTPVAVTIIEPQLFESTVALTGTLHPASSVSVSARVGGKATYVIGRTGTKVSRGQVIARLDTADLSIQLKNANAAVNSAKARLQQAEAAYTQQRVSTDNGIITAKANLEAAEARLAQAKSTYNSTTATLNSQVKQAEEGLISAQNRLQSVKSGARTQEKEIAQASLRTAEANLSKAQTDYNSMKNLYDNGAISKNTFLGYETALEIARQQYNTAKQSHDLTMEGARPEDVTIAESSVRQAQAAVDAARANLTQADVQKDNVLIAETGVRQAKAALENAKSAIYADQVRDKDILAARAGVQQAQAQADSIRQNISYATITSPVNGVIEARSIEVGQNVMAGSPIFTVTTDSSFYFEAQVSELEASSIKAGDPIKISIDALQDEQVTCLIEKVVPVIDSKTRQFTVRVIVPAVNGIYAGMFARAAAVSERVPNSIVVPRNAVVERDDKQYVFIASEGKAKEVEVKLGAIVKSDVQILSGLNFGDKLITGGQQGLINDDDIEIEDTVTNGESK